ncbi:hypothetical protein I4U23_017021 [Adineta vaga]|nr:hypothetical protein I4U23_017021 [Adineta vaga]
MVVVFLLIHINGISALSFNQPKFCPTVKWSRNATTFFGSDVLGRQGGKIFINTNNTIYVAANEKRQILVWHENNTQPMIIHEEDWTPFVSIFVSNIGEIYISLDSIKKPFLHSQGLSESARRALLVSDIRQIYISLYNTSRTIKWKPSTNSSVNIMKFTIECSGLFIDINNYLYCTYFMNHIVVKTWLDDEKGKIVVAGTGKGGSAPDELHLPKGIFVDTNLDLYVADWFNGRIQLFPFGEKNGQTVAGKGASDITIALSKPDSIILDAGGYLFILDTSNKRIVASGPNGFRCLLGCGRNVEESDKLVSPNSFSFDIYGNIFIYDGNSQIKKFDLQKESCKNISPTMQLTYSTNLTKNHKTFSRTNLNESNYHYEFIEFIVSKNDSYTLTANSSIDLYGHLYKDSFDRFNPTKNLIAWYGKCCNKDQFKFTLELLANTQYILIVTTYKPNITGLFSIIIFGSNKVRFGRRNPERNIHSTYTSTLTKDHEIYFPMSCDRTNGYYYEAIQIEVIESGFYDIINTNKMDMSIPFGIYKHDFYPLIPAAHLLVESVACLKSDQSKITVELLSKIRYILFVRACSQNITWDFSVKIAGRNRVNFRRINASSANYVNYSSELTTNSQIYDKTCFRSYYYYETLRMTLPIDAYYVISTSRRFNIEINIYKNHFDALNPSQNLISDWGVSTCYNSNGEVEYTRYLRSDITYILLVTTFDSLITKPFSISLYGTTNITLERIKQKTHL